MSSTQPHSPLTLPLSWARTGAVDPVFNTVELRYTSHGWIPTAEIPHHYSFERVYQELLSRLPNGFVLQSCGVDLRDFLIQQGCQAVAMGAEAILDLPWRGKRSVRELARRGRRHGRVREIDNSALHQRQLAQLRRHASARRGVQLRHTERPEFDANTRCFILETSEHQWLGAITLSTTAPGYVHTELLLRHQSAPVGIMEALITAIADQLSLEGVRHLSLGNVTPLPSAEGATILAAARHPDELWTRSQLSFRLGRALSFAHNADGLWRFKNKFSPRWEPLYLCASPRLSWATVAGMLQAMGYFELVWDRLRAARPTPRPRLSLPRPAPDALSPAGIWALARDRVKVATTSAGGNRFH